MGARPRTAFLMVANVGVSFSKGLRELSCRITQMLERITDLANSTETLIDDTHC